MQDLTVDMLLLDLRDEEDYAQYHLQGGKLFSLQITCSVRFWELFHHLSGWRQ